jgi:hypothetical protein
MNKEPTKDIQEESAKLPGGSSLEFHSSHKSEMKEGHNAVSGTFGDGSVSEITVNDYTQQFANSENDVDGYGSRVVQ